MSTAESTLTRKEFEKNIRGGSYLRHLWGKPPYKVKVISHTKFKDSVVIGKKTTVVVLPIDLLDGFLDALILQIMEGFITFGVFFRVELPDMGILVHIIKDYEGVDSSQIAVSISYKEGCEFELLRALRHKGYDCGEPIAA